MDCGEGSGTCSAWQNNHRCFTELHGAFQSDADAGLTSCGGGTQVIPTPSHLLGRISPISPRFPPFFARFHRLDEAVPTSRKPEPRAEKQPARVSKQ